MPRLFCHGTDIIRKLLENHVIRHLEAGPGQGPNWNPAPRHVSASPGYEDPRGRRNLRDSQSSPLLLSIRKPHPKPAMNTPIGGQWLPNPQRARWATMLMLLLVTEPALAQTSTQIEQSLEQCGRISDSGRRLACFDAVRAQLGSKPAPPQAPSTQFAQPAPAPTTANPNYAHEPGRNQPIIARVNRYVLDRHGKFTVYLDNGQAWRQLESGDNTAQFRSNGMNLVTISPGFWGSYNLRLNRESAIYKVKRVSP